MSQLSDYAKNQCKFAGVSEVRAAGKNQIVIKIQTNGERNSFKRQKN